VSTLQNMSHGHKITNRYLGNLICLPIFIAFFLAIISGNFFEYEKTKMRRGYWKCPEGTHIELQNPLNYFQKAMPFFSVITSTAHTFSAAIWRMTIGATSGLRIFILPMVYVRYFNTRFDKTLICTATIIESLGIMGLTYCLTMAPNQLYEAVSRIA